MKKNSSLYKKTIVRFGYMEHYNPILIPFDDSDLIITVEKKYNQHPGKLAYDLYGNERLGWIFSYFNRKKIQDPIFDLVDGITIRVPTKERLNNYI